MQSSTIPSKLEVDAFARDVMAGNIEFKKEQYKNAIELYEHALQKQPENIPLLVQCARAYQKDNQKEKADLLFKKVSELKPQEAFTLKYAKEIFNCELKSDNIMRDRVELEQRRMAKEAFLKQDALDNQQRELRVASLIKELKDSDFISDETVTEAHQELTLLIKRNGNKSLYYFQNALIDYYMNEKEESCLRLLIQAGQHDYDHRDLTPELRRELFNFSTTIFLLKGIIPDNHLFLKHNLSDPQFFIAKAQEFYDAKNNIDYAYYCLSFALWLTCHPDNNNLSIGKKIIHIADIYRTRSVILVKLERLDEAVKDYKKLEGHFPDLLKHTTLSSDQVQTHKTNQFKKFQLAVFAKAKEKIKPKNCGNSREILSAILEIDPQNEETLKLIKGLSGDAADSKSNLAAEVKTTTPSPSPAPAKSLLTQFEEKNNPTNLIKDLRRKAKLYLENKCYSDALDCIHQILKTSELTHEIREAYVNAVVGEIKIKRKINERDNLIILQEAMKLIANSKPPKTIYYLWILHLSAAIATDTDEILHKLILNDLSNNDLTSETRNEVLELIFSWKWYKNKTNKHALRDPKLYLTRAQTFIQQDDMKQALLNVDLTLWLNSPHGVGFNNKNFDIDREARTLKIELLLKTEKLNDAVSEIKTLNDKFLKLKEQKKISTNTLKSLNNEFKHRVINAFLTKAEQLYATNQALAEQYIAAALRFTPQNKKVLELNKRLGFAKDNTVADSKQEDSVSQDLCSQEKEQDEQAAAQEALRIKEEENLAEKIMKQQIKEAARYAKQQQKIRAKKMLRAEREAIEKEPKEQEEKAELEHKKFTAAQKLLDQEHQLLERLWKLEDAEEADRLTIQAAEEKRILLEEKKIDEEDEELDRLLDEYDQETVQITNQLEKLTHFFKDREAKLAAVETELLEYKKNLSEEIILPLSAVEESFLSIFLKQGTKVAIIGGTVVNKIKNTFDPKADIDFVVALPKDKIREILKQENIDFLEDKNKDGLFDITFNGITKIQIYSSQAPDVAVTPEISAEESLKKWIANDLKSRDFTIGGLYLIPAERNGKMVGVLKDPTGRGRLHLSENTLMTIEEKPEISFAEDPLRMMRALKFVFTKKITLDERVRTALHQTNIAFTQKQAHRFSNFLNKILISDYATLYFEALFKEKMIEKLFPGLAAGIIRNKNWIINQLNQEGRRTLNEIHVMFLVAAFKNVDDKEQTEQRLDSLKTAENNPLWHYAQSSEISRREFTALFDYYEKSLKRPDSNAAPSHAIKPKPQNHQSTLLIGPPLSAYNLPPLPSSQHPQAMFATNKGSTVMQAVPDKKTPSP